MDYKHQVAADVKGNFSYWLSVSDVISFSFVFYRTAFLRSGYYPGRIIIVSITSFVCFKVHHFVITISTESSLKTELPVDYHVLYETILLWFSSMYNIFGFIR